MSEPSKMSDQLLFIGGRMHGKTSESYGKQFVQCPVLPPLSVSYPGDDKYPERLSMEYETYERIMFEQESLGRVVTCMVKQGLSRRQVELWVAQLLMDGKL